MGTVSLSISTSSSGPPIYILTHNEVGTIRQVMLDYLPLLKIYDFYWTNGRKHKVSMDTILGSDNSGSNSGRVLTKSTSLARESRVDQLRNRGVYLINPQVYLIQPWSRTSQKECYDSLDVDNRFP
ncbi:uncharacterized protein LOC128042404 [Gossypium raimondii]|uniref:uncharacterized protein LOC128042404 n=1 Tax=Gossypium raimondii TaxID=29730 RepID=UPI00227C1A5A|nr:uncharacterized protein LOC128042404 [Gossypium raimondii]XP_052489301.1 uncharacterized protein LOC128042404 [Gossypium raimondii]XP_052489303.1 uncharacterized protein LOC128042404 [Gossypium raimondii]